MTVSVRTPKVTGGCAANPASSRSVTRLPAACVIQAAVGWAVAPQDVDAAAGVLDDREDVHAHAGHRDRLRLLHHHDLMARREDLGILVPITARQQPSQ